MTGYQRITNPSRGELYIYMPTIKVKKLVTRSNAGEDTGKTGLLRECLQKIKSYNQSGK